MTRLPSPLELNYSAAVCLVDSQLQEQRSPAPGLYLWIWLLRDLSCSYILWAAVWKKNRYF